MARAPKLGTQIRQEQILQAALALLSERGLRGLNLAATARRIGVVPSAIYRHFSNKEALLSALIDMVASRLEQNVQEACDQTDDAVERLHRLLNRHVELIRQNQGILRMVFSPEIAGGSTRHKKQIHHMLTRYLQRIGQILQEGQRERKVRPDLDVGVTALLFVGIIQPAAFIWTISDGDFDVTRHARKAWEIFRHAIEVD